MKNRREASDRKRRQNRREGQLFHRLLAAVIVTGILFAVLLVTAGIRDGSLRLPSFGSGRRKAAAESASGNADTQTDAEGVTMLGENYSNDAYWKGCPDIMVELLTPNSYSRPQIAMQAINGIVIHYTANPGTGAQANRDYFEGLKDGTEGVYASAHFVVGLDGEIIQCIPSSEIAYATSDRNTDTVSIECCHPDESGKFDDATYESCVKLAAWMCRAYSVDPENVMRHYDITGKDCPKYYVEHPEAWEQMKADITEQYAKIKNG